MSCEDGSPWKRRSKKNKEKNRKERKKWQTEADRLTAWKFFSSSEVAGLSLGVQGCTEEYVIASSVQLA